MSNWDDAYALSAKNEGGISTDNKDKGNYFKVGNADMFVATRYGQTFENWLTYNKKKKPTTGSEFNSLKKEFENVTKEDVKASFKAQYWDKYNLDKITDGKVASNVYDAMINQSYTLGGSGSHSTLSDVLNSLGYETDANTSFSTNEKAIDALNKAIDEKGGEAVNKAYSDRREKSYMGSKTVDEHGKGWLKRLNEYRNEEDQYSQNELNEMSFTSDSTSNMAILDAIKNPETEPVNAETALVNKRQEQKDESSLKYSVYELTSEEEEKIKNAAIETASDLHSRIKKGELDGSDDEIKNLYYKELSKKIGIVDIDVNDANSLGKARGYIEYATSISNEELGEQIGGRQFWDSKIEDVLENWSNNVNWNLENLGIPKRGQITEGEPLFSGSVSASGTTSTHAKITPPETELENIILTDAKLVEEAAKLGLTPSELADKKLKEKDEAFLDHSLKRGLEKAEDISEYSDIEEEEESMESLGLNEDGTSKKPPKDRANKMKGAEAALSGLKAAAGILSLSQALAEPDVETPELSPLIQEAVQKQAQLAKSGLTAQEKNAAMSNLNNAYAGAMKNVLRASGGQRGLYLANQGTVDANRIAGLNQLAAQDAAMHRENIKQYNALATSVGQMKLQRDMSVEQMRQTTLNNNRQILSGIGTNLLSDAISDVGYYLNPNRKATEEMTKKILGGGSYSGENYNNPYMNAPVGTASKTADELAAEMKAKKEQENID